MEYLYGKFTSNQIAETKKRLRASIFFLLVCVDKNTASKYENVDVDNCFHGILLRLASLNKLLLNQPELVSVITLLQAARDEYHNPDFNFKTYRKLILDAGAEVARLREV